MTFSFFSRSWINEYKTGDVWNCRECEKLVENEYGEQWKLLLASNGEDLEEVNVKSGIFQGASLPPLLFILSRYHCH